MERNNETIKTRIATSSDIGAANVIQMRVLPPPHYYQYANNILSQGTYNLIATKGIETIGFISILTNQPNPIEKYLWERMRPYIAFVGVLPEHQGKGIGEILVKSSSKHVLDNSSRNHIFLETDETTKEFYEKIGFTHFSPEEVNKRFGLFPKTNVYCAHRQVFSLE